MGDVDIGPAREREEEGRTLAAHAPGLEAPRVEAGVLEGDRQAQAGPARLAGAGGVGAPEAVEDVLEVLGRDPDAVVADEHRDRIVVGRDGDLDGRALAVFDGVVQEIAQDPVDAALASAASGASPAGEAR